MPGDAEKKIAPARRLRRDATRIEQILWWRLANRQMDGLKFRRQHPIGPYVADFACPSIRLVVELDGDQHGRHLEYDQARTAYLATRGYRVIRFDNRDVSQRLDDVLEAIQRATKGDLR